MRFGGIALSDVLGKLRLDVRLAAARLETEVTQFVAEQSQERFSVLEQVWGHCQQTGRVLVVRELILACPDSTATVVNI